MMSRRFTFVTVALTAVGAVLGGAILAGRGPPSSGSARDTVGPNRSAAPARVSQGAVPGTLVNFADVVERINPAVVNIDATTRGTSGSGERKRRRQQQYPDPPELFDRPDSTLPRSDMP